MTRLEQNVSQFISCFMLCQMSRDFCRKPVTKLEKEKKFTNIFDVLMSYQKIILYLKQEGEGNCVKIQIECLILYPF